MTDLRRRKSCPAPRLFPREHRHLALQPACQRVFRQLEVVVCLQDQPICPWPTWSCSIF